MSLTVLQLTISFSKKFIDLIGVLAVQLLVGYIATIHQKLEKIPGILWQSDQPQLDGFQLIQLDNNKQNRAKACTHRVNFLPEVEDGSQCLSPDVLVKLVFPRVDSHENTELRDDTRADEPLS